MWQSKVSTVKENTWTLIKPPLKCLPTAAARLGYLFSTRSEGEQRHLKCTRHLLRASPSTAGKLVMFAILFYSPESVFKLQLRLIYTIPLQYWSPERLLWMLERKPDLVSLKLTRFQWSICSLLLFGDVYDKPPLMSHHRIQKNVYSVDAQKYKGVIRVQVSRFKRKCYILILYIFPAVTYSIRKCFCLCSIAANMYLLAAGDIWLVAGLIVFSHSLCSFYSVGCWIESMPSGTSAWFEIRQGQHYTSETCLCGKGSEREREKEWKKERNCSLMTMSGCSSTRLVEFNEFWRPLCMWRTQLTEKILFDHQQGQTASAIRTETKGDKLELELLTFVYMYTT